MTAAIAAPPRVSVILPVYNGARFVRAAIDAVLGQSFAAFELVIVNDGSTDASEAVIAPVLSRPNVRYLAQPNQGVAAARNAGIRAARGEFVALIDQDDVWLPEKLALQVRYMDSHPEVGLLHTGVGFIDAESRPLDRLGPGWVAECAGWCTDRLLAGNPIAPVTALFRRQCLDAVGLFDPECVPADDWDLWLRLSRQAQVGFLPEVTALYRYHDGNESRNVLKMKLAEIRVVEGFLRRDGARCDRREREIAEAKLRKFYDRAARLLREAGRDAEAAAFRRRLFLLRLGASLRRVGLAGFPVPWGGNGRASEAQERRGAQRPAGR
jgi:glycosyltransferase involved in cell wall biosynthesis